MAADAVMLIGDGWREARQTPTGSAPQLILSNISDRASVLLLRFPLSAFLTDEATRIRSIQLSLCFSSPADPKKPFTAEILSVSGLANWPELKFTSLEWADSPAARRLTITPPLATARFMCEEGDASARHVFLLDRDLFRSVVETLKGEETSITLAVRLSGAQGNAVVVASKEAAGPLGPLLQISYTGAYCPEFDPKFTAWRTPEERTAFHQLRGGGAAPVVSVSGQGSERELKMFWRRDDRRIASSSGWLDTPCPIFALDDFSLSFELEWGEGQGDVGFFLEVIPWDREGSAPIWRKPLASSQTTASGSVISFEWGPDDFEAGATLKADPTTLSSLESVDMSALLRRVGRPFLRWRFEAKEDGAWREARVRQLALSPSLDQTATGKILLGPTVDLNSDQGEGALHPSVGVIVDADRLYTGGGFDAAIALAEHVPGIEVMAHGPLSPLSSAWGGRLKQAGARWTLWASVEDLAFQSISQSGAWSEFPDGHGPLSLHRLATDADFRDQATLLTRSARGAVALAGAEVAPLGYDALVLDGPGWPRHARRRTMGGAGNAEAQTLIQWLSGETVDGAHQSPEPLGDGFPVWFRREVGGFYPPSWYGLNTWNAFRPDFRIAAAGPHASRIRFLSRQLARYAWLEFVDGVTRRMRAAAPSLAFQIASPANATAAGAVPWKALRDRSVESICLPLDVTDRRRAFDRVAHAWSAQRRFHVPTSKKLGVRLSQSNEKPSTTRDATIDAWMLRAAAGVESICFESDLDEGTRAVARSYAQGLADAAQDSPVALALPETLVIGPDVAWEGLDAFDEQRPYANLTPLLCELGIPFDFLTPSDRPESFDVYRVIVYNAPQAPQGLIEELGQWLRRDASRRLLMVGAQPTRSLHVDSFWLTPSHTNDPTVAIDSMESAMVGLKEIRSYRLESPVFNVKVLDPRLSVGSAARFVFSPGHRTVYDAEPDGAMTPLAEIERFLPLISEGRPLPSSGKTVYFHYNIGWPAPAQRRVDYELMQSICDTLGMGRRAIYPQGWRVYPYRVSGGYAVVVAPPAEGAASASKAPVRLALPEDDGEKINLWSLTTDEPWETIVEAGWVDLVLSPQRDIIFLSKSTASESPGVEAGRRQGLWR